MKEHEIRIRKQDVCSRCGEFVEIAGQTFDGKLWCQDCLMDKIYEANITGDFPYRAGEPPTKETLEDLKRIGWLK